MYTDDYDDGSYCCHCGVYLEVIGPPGPIHASNCPSAEPKDTSPQLTDSEVAEVFRRWNFGEDADSVLRELLERRKRA